MKSKARQGLDALLEAFPNADVAHVVSQDPYVVQAAYEAAIQELFPGHIHQYTGPWTTVDLVVSFGKGGLTVVTVRKFGIWNATGNVYEGDEFGAMPEDAFITITPPAA